MPSLHALDWIGLTFLAYGLVAGFMRGLVNQSTRIAVLLLALVCSAWLAAAGIQIASWIPVESEQAAYALSDMLFFGLLLVFLTGVRRFLFGWLESPSTGLSRFGGLALGIVGAWILYGVALCGYSWWIQDGEEELANMPGIERIPNAEQVANARDASGYPLAEAFVKGAALLPSPPRPQFLDAEQLTGIPVEAGD